MTPVFQPVQDLMRGATSALRDALRRAVLATFAGLIAAVGGAFLLWAAFIGLRMLMGPGLAALVIGLALLALAAGLLALRVQPKSVTPSPLPPKTDSPSAPPDRSADAATAAVFTAAFLLGRRLADWRGPDRTL
jgi:fatty acid desaturase